MRTADAPTARRVLLPAASVIRVEDRSGWPLLVAAVLALCWANSPWGDSYGALWHTELAIELGGFAQRESLRHWVNDLLLPLFFFVIGMEVKQELARGELASAQRAALPLAAALGGVLVPAALYLAITWGSEAARGWGIPVATDIAFALAILALVGDRVPPALRVLVLAFAAIDDVIAVLLIAFIYSGALSWPALGIAALLFAAMFGLRGARVRSLAVFSLLGVAVWLCVLLSGVHATIAGVVLGLLVPTRPASSPDAFAARAIELVRGLDRSDTPERRDELLGELDEELERVEAPAERLAHLVNPWVGYVVLPMFALANAGIPLSASVLAEAVGSAALWAVAAGLLVGKPVGILLFCWAAVRLGVARLPEGLDWRQLAGMGALAGMGFTISLFIDQLAFRGEPALRDAAKLGVLGASLVAGLAGFAVLRWSPARAGRGAGSPE